LPSSNFLCTNCFDNHNRELTKTLIGNNNRNRAAVFKGGALQNGSNNNNKTEPPNNCGTVVTQVASLQPKNTIVDSAAARGDVSSDIPTSNQIVFKKRSFHHHQPSYDSALSSMNAINGDYCIDDVQTRHPSGTEAKRETINDEKRSIQKEQQNQIQLNSSIVEESFTVSQENGGKLLRKLMVDAH